MYSPIHSHAGRTGIAPDVRLADHHLITKLLGRKLVGVSLAVSVLALGAIRVVAHEGAPPLSFVKAVQPIQSVQQYLLRPTDVASEKALDAANPVKVPLRFAVAQPVQITSANYGTWETLPEGRLWRLRVASSGATDLNMGFTRFKLPPGATLHLISESESYYQGPYTEVDSGQADQLWTPVVPGDAAIIELFVPNNAGAEPELELTQVSTGYRDMFHRTTSSDTKAESCELDVVCPVAAPWANEIRSVARISIGGTALCSGSMIMDAPGDFRAFFLTANHCGVSSGNASTVVVYWNYQSPTCGMHGLGGSLAQNQSGSTFRAAKTDVDFCLIELSQLPPPAYKVYYAGWDRSGKSAAGCVGIHHPRGDGKCISFSSNAVTTVNSCIGTGGSATHWQVTWTLAVTEPGSSGSGIWDPATRLLLGTLSGGGSDCASPTLPDCYGKFSVMWNSGATAASRLKEWLDPQNTGITNVAGSDPVVVITGIQPTNQVVLQNQPASFTVTAAGLPPLSYQWRKNGQPIPGATTNTYSIAAAQVSDSGNYQAVVTNLSGSATSAVATLTVTPTISLPVALDTSNLSWTVSSSTPWFGQTNVFHPSGTNAASARSFPIGDGQQSTLTTTTTGPGTLMFWWKVSSQPAADFLKFTASSAAVTNSFQISGEVDWNQQLVYLPSGPVTLQWVYSKDASGSSGNDVGYVDQVVVTNGGTKPIILTQPLSQSGTAGRPVTFAVGANGTPVLKYQWQHNNLAIAGATGSSFTIPNPVSSDLGTYSVSISNSFGVVQSTDASLFLVPIGVAGTDSSGQLTVPGGASNAVAIAAGGWHSLAVRADGQVLAWGNNFDGQCDLPAGLSGVFATAGGGYHSLALKVNGTVVGWGANGNGQSSPPAGLSNVVAIAAGSWHSLALRANGTIVAWGDNSLGQCTVPAGLNNAIAIAAGGNHSLALLNDGSVVAWGDNADALGNYAGQSVVPPLLSGVTAIAAGTYHSLAVRADGTVVAWGDNSSGQSTAPEGLSNVVSVAGGGAHSLALRANGTVAGWGDNWFGQIGFSPTLGSVVQIAAGDSHSLVLLGTAAGRPVLMQPVRTGHEFRVLLQTVAGKHYTLQSNLALGAPTWVSLATVIGNGALQVLADPAASEPAKFYRVLSW